MHKCVVHFIPLNKQTPHCKQHPGFIVRKVYDTDLKRLFKLTDKYYKDNKRHAIDLLVQKTMPCLGDLPDIDTVDAAANQEDQLRKFKALTGETSRDKWLEKLLQEVEFICSSVEGNVGDVIVRKGEPIASQNLQRGLKTRVKILEQHLSGLSDAAVPVVSAVEVSHETLSSDFTKYNQKMRQLCFNVKRNALLAQRLLNGELEPSKILNMSPNELKAGLTAEEIASSEPAESAGMQMKDAWRKRWV